LSLKALKTLDLAGGGADMLDRQLDLVGRRHRQVQIGTRQHAAEHTDSEVDAAGVDAIGSHA
jgi:hypothetical protein